MNSEDKARRVILWGACAVLSSMFIAALIAIPADDMGVFFVLSAVGLGIWALVFFAKISENREKSQKESLEKFYTECKKQNIVNIHDSFQAKKAVLVAQNLGMKEKDYGNIISLYENAKKHVLEEEQKKLREKEKAEYENLNKYSDIYGRDKRVQMLTDLQNEYNQRAKILHQGACGLVSASQQKEIDWALHGGIASGLAGGAAGVAVAVDKQIKNAQIREQNQANLRSITPSLLKLEEASMGWSRKARDMQHLIDEANLKVVSDMSHDDVMKHLSFSKITADISETGSFKISATVKVKSPVEIMGRKAVVDGTVMATMYQNEKIIGSAALVFPVFGVDSTAELLGMYRGRTFRNEYGYTEYIPSEAVQNVPYEIVIEASDNLWIMEK